jgi:SAM-dependent methyltransferase
MDDATFVPAAGRRGLTSLYDPVVALTMREPVFRSRLVAQVAAGSPAAVLEIGCGTGSLTTRLAEALPTASITGLDPDAAVLACAHAKDQAHRITWLNGTAVDLPLPDQSVDRVVASLVLQMPRSSECLPRHTVCCVREGACMSPIGERRKIRSCTPLSSYYGLSTGLTAPARTPRVNYPT